MLKYINFIKKVYKFCPFGFQINPMQWQEYAFHCRIRAVGTQVGHCGLTVKRKILRYEICKAHGYIQLGMPRGT